MPEFYMIFARKILFSDFFGGKGVWVRVGANAPCSRFLRPCRQ